MKSDHLASLISIVKENIYFVKVKFSLPVYSKS